LLVEVLVVVAVEVIELLLNVVQPVHMVAQLEVIKVTEVRLGQILPVAVVEVLGVTQFILVEAADQDSY
jgi:protein-S-isoprenylcysteine O-methyltransferase Ste14